MIYLLKLATAFTGELFNIDALNQPGVEAGKVRPYALLGRPGFEEERHIDVQKSSVLQVSLRTMIHGDRTFLDIYPMQTELRRVQETSFRI